MPLHSRCRPLYSARSLLNTRNHQDVAEQEQAALLALRLAREHRHEVEEEERALARHQVGDSLDDQLEFSQRRLPLPILERLPLLAVQMHQDVVHQTVRLLQQTLVRVVTFRVLYQS